MNGDVTTISGIARQLSERFEEEIDESWVRWAIREGLVPALGPDNAEDVFNRATVVRAAYQGGAPRKAVRAVLALRGE